MGNGQLVNDLGIGTCEVDFGLGHVLTLANVLYAPEIIHNLISIRKLTECKHKVHFEGTNVLVKCDTGVIFSGFIKGNLCVISESVFMLVLLNADLVSDQ